MRRMLRRWRWCTTSVKAQRQSLLFRVFRTARRLFLRAAFSRWTFACRAHLISLLSGLQARCAILAAGKLRLFADRLKRRRAASCFLGELSSYCAAHCAYCGVTTPLCCREAFHITTRSGLSVLSSSFSSCCAAWAAHCRRCVRDRRVVTLAHRAQATRRQLRAFFRWRVAARNGVCSRAVTSRHCVAGTMRRVFYALREAGKRRQRAFMLLQRSARILTSKCRPAHAFRVWHAFASSRKRALRLLHDVSRARVSRALHRSLLRWAHATVACREHSKVLYEQCFVSLRRWIVLSRAQRYAIASVQRTLDRRQLTRSLIKWLMITHRFTRKVSAAAAADVLWVEGAVISLKSCKFILSLIAILDATRPPLLIRLSCR